MGKSFQIHSRRKSLMPFFHCHFLIILYFSFCMLGTRQNKTNKKRKSILVLYFIFGKYLRFLVKTKIMIACYNNFSNHRIAKFVFNLESMLTNYNLNYIMLNHDRFFVIHCQLNVPVYGNQSTDCKANQLAGFFMTDILQLYGLSRSHTLTGNF